MDRSYAKATLKVVSLVALVGHLLFAFLGLTELWNDVGHLRRHSEWMMTALPLVALIVPTAFIWWESNRPTSKQSIIVGLLGGLVMVLLMQAEMWLVDLAHSARPPTWSDVLPDGQIQAAYVGLGNLAFVTRVQAEAIDLLARVQTKPRHWAWLVSISIIAVMVGLPLWYLGVPNAALAPDLLEWELPAVGHAMTVIAFEVCTWFPVRQRPRIHFQSG